MARPLKVFRTDGLSRASKRLALRLATIQAGAHPFDDSAAFKFGQGGQ
jgi:hypothetical protein